MMLAVYLCNIINHNLGILNQPVPELFSYNENRAGYEIDLHPRQQGGVGAMF